MSDTSMSDMSKLDTSLSNTTLSNNSMQNTLSSDAVFSQLKRVQASYQKVVRLNIIVWALIFSSGVAFLGFMLYKANDDNTLFFLILIIPFAFFLLLFLFYPQKVYKYTHFGLVDEVFYVQKGWLFKKRTAVAQNRIQHTDVEQGPFLRKYGLAQLILHTAGVKEADISISGLDYAEAIGIRDHLLELNKQNRQNNKEKSSVAFSHSKSSDATSYNSKLPLDPSEKSIATSVLALNSDKNIALTEEE